MLILVSISLLVACGRPPDAPSLPEPIARQQAAFNAKDVEALGNGVTDDFIWYAMREGSASIEVSGRDALMAGMRDYFASLPTANSRIESFSVLDDQVAVVERVSWAGSDGSQHSQAALAVYQLRDNAIARVWYFEAVR